MTSFRCQGPAGKLAVRAYQFDFPARNTCTLVIITCTTIHRYPIFSIRYSVMCKVCTGYRGTSEIEHSLCACTVDNPLAKARGLSLRTGAQTMLYLSHVNVIIIKVVWHSTQPTKTTYRNRACSSNQDKFVSVVSRTIQPPVLEIRIKRLPKLKCLCKNCLKNFLRQRS